MISVKSRVHRILLHLNNFKGSSEDATGLLGVYENTGSDLRTIDVFQDKACFKFDKEHVVVRYSEIKSILPMQDKSDTRLKILKNDGSVVEFNITTGHERVLDVFEWIRFFTRVVSDLN